MAGKISEYPSKTVFNDTDLYDCSTAGTASEQMTYLQLKTNLESALAFLASGDNVSDLVNDAGYLTTALQNGDVDLGYTASTRTVTNTAGDDTVLPLFTSTEAGLAPLSGGGTTNFLRADGTWAAAGGGGDSIYTASSFIGADRTVALDDNVTTGHTLVFEELNGSSMLLLNGSTGVFSLGLNATPSISSGSVTIGKNSSTFNGVSQGLGIAIGQGASAISINPAIAIGENAKWEDATGAGISLGYQAGVSTTTFGDGSIIIGVSAGGATVGIKSTAIGIRANASAQSAVCLGSDTDATGQNAISIGNNSVASGSGSIALGANSTASASNSILISSGSGIATNSVANSLGIGFIGDTSPIISFAQSAVNYINGSSGLVIGGTTLTGSEKLKVEGDTIVNGDCDATTYSVNGVAGAVGGTFTTITSITVVDGIITAISGS